MTIMKSENLSISAEKSPLPVSLAAIEQAAGRLAGQVERTPLVRSDNLSERCGHPVHLKLETLQPIGAFKLRGAMNAIFSLDDEARKRGLVTASTGNHGRAVAYAAEKLGIPATICMSELVPTNKVEAIRALGADIRIVGRSQDDAQEEVERLTRSRGLTAIPPFDHSDVVAGQGTIGLEVVEDMPELATILVPLSGGGLAGGIAVAVKALKPRARVVGISMERGAAMHASVKAGRPVSVQEEETLADSLGGGIGLANRVTFALCQALLDDIVLVSEDEIAAGIRHAAHEEGLRVEGAGAVAFAAVLSGKVNISGPTAIIVSGENIDPALHKTIIDRGAA
ncbi:hydroxyectoine utilization dehydratase EutB [Agrobacterium pusense]|uniref:hydroxyectoine utilization dehydratase EutB n=1 Tax=Agrobacterium pusense TaxID=648995 RepID=UPI000CA1F3B6|nr:hydroxyectoine utilization dehydratase EutB [Agrobacterium pusense]AUC12285.1 hydroxyectoine utilization dehydratase EutB [Rhizobium sp. Y9]MDP9772044.1 threonine dehydratase [Rhizobium sp. SORGH_AS_0755]